MLVSVLKKLASEALFQTTKSLEKNSFLENYNSLKIDFKHWQMNMKPLHCFVERMFWKLFLKTEIITCFSFLHQTCWIVRTMPFPCRSENCKKQFSTKFNRNRHEWIKKHYQADEGSIHNIPYDEQTKLYSCLTTNCTTSRYEQNIIKHLTLCYSVNKKAKSKNG